MKIRYFEIVIALGIVLLAAFFRFYGVNWDQNQHLHPDERFLTMVTLAMKWPQDLNQYLDAASSPLNPHNIGYTFFVYGLFPLTLTKWVVESVGQADYSSVTLIGRQVSALFDMGTVVLVFLIGTQLHGVGSYMSNKSHKTHTIGLLAAFLYSVMVLPIQLSHFYAVDTFLTFFINLSFYLGCKLLTDKFHFSPLYQISKIKYQIYRLNIKNITILLLSGISFGLALSSKISAVLFLPIMFFLILFKSYLTVYTLKPIKVKIFNFLYVFLIFNILFLISTYLTFRLGSPYTFANSSILDVTLNPKVVANWEQLESFNDPTGGFPPSVQWITTKPYLFPLKNMMLWGLGVPMGILALLAIGYGLWVMGYGLIKRKYLLQLLTDNLPLNLMLLWIMILFAYQGGQFVKALRYFYPMYPFLAIVSGWFIARTIENMSYKFYTSHRSNRKNGKILLIVHCSLFIVFMVYPLSFISIYSRPHTRIAASEWIYKNIPAGKTLSSEHWDDGLPLSLENFIHERYKKVEFPLYHPDTVQKWQEMAKQINETDYIILSSNRLYGSITTVPQKYPVTAKFYEKLFDGSLGFTKVAEFTSRPNLPIPGLRICLIPPLARYGIVARDDLSCPLPGVSFVDDYADETFTVYDHPKVTIFKKIRALDYFDILYKKSV